MEIARCISFYEKEGDSHIGDFNVDSLSFDFLSSLFNPPHNDPLLYDVYEIDEKLALEIQKRIDFNFDFDRFEYFLECYQK